MVLEFPHLLLADRLWRFGLPPMGLDWRKERGWYASRLSFRDSQFATLDNALSGMLHAILLRLVRRPYGPRQDRDQIAGAKLPARMLGAAATTIAGVAPGGTYALEIPSQRVETMSSDRPAPDEIEIEITPEMVEAASDAYYIHWDDDFPNPALVMRRVIEAALRCARMP